MHSLRETFVGVVVKCAAIPAPFWEINLLNSPQNMTALWEDYDFFCFHVCERANGIRQFNHMPLCWIGVWEAQTGALKWNCVPLFAQMSFESSFSEVHGLATCSQSPF